MIRAVQAWRDNQSPAKMRQSKMGATSSPRNGGWQRGDGRVPLTSILLTETEGIVTERKVGVMLPRDSPLF